MSTDNTPTPDDQAASQTPPDVAAIELAALKAQLAETAKGLLANVPEHLKALVPGNLSPADQIDWFNKAKATGVFDKPKVPPTESNARPAIIPPKPDFSQLPVHARLAAGYKNQA
ncbi:MAG: hypothetical protein JOY99_04115 [Sphingomonadaceae bacterium]|nr:hypothetical protein [Sphingomonadaceae bacterium]